MSKKPKVNSNLVHFYTITHLLIGSVVVYILYLSFSNEFQLFTWHPILLSVGWLFLMTEAILALSSNNFLSQWIPIKYRLLSHWSLQIAASFCIVSGFLIVYINKNLNDKEHFTTWHGTFGLISIISLIPTCLLGLLSLYKFNLRTILKPSINKFVHIFCGVVTFTIGSVTILLSLYSMWFVKKATNIAQILCFISILYSYIFIMYRPVKMLYNKYKSIS